MRARRERAPPVAGMGLRRTASAVTALSSATPARTTQGLRGERPKAGYADALPRSTHGMCQPRRDACEAPLRRRGKIALEPGRDLGESSLVENALKASEKRSLLGAHMGFEEGAESIEEVSDLSRLGRP